MHSPIIMVFSWYALVTADLQVDKYEAGEYLLLGHNTCPKPYNNGATSYIPGVSLAVENVAIPFHNHYHKDGSRTNKHVTKHDKDGASEENKRDREEEK